MQGRPFVIRGQIQRGNVLTGVWSDREKGGTYFGAFQLIIDPIPNRMQGRWIGFSGNNAVVMPFAGLDGVRRGCRSVIANAASQVRPSPSSSRALRR